MPRTVNLNADPKSIEGYFIKGLRAAGLTDEQISKKLWPCEGNKILLPETKLNLIKEN